MCSSAFGRGLHLCRAEGRLLVALVNEAFTPRWWYCSPLPKKSSNTPSWLVELFLPFKLNWGKVLFLSESSFALLVWLL